jgi:hypothetical protein
MKKLSIIALVGVILINSNASAMQYAVRPAARVAARYAVTPKTSPWRAASARWMCTEAVPKATPKAAPPKPRDVKKQSWSEWWSGPRIAEEATARFSWKTKAAMATIGAGTVYGGMWYLNEQGCLVNPWLDASPAFARANATKFAASRAAVALMGEEEVEGIEEVAAEAKEAPSLLDAKFSTNVPALPANLVSGEMTELQAMEIIGDLRKMIKNGEIDNVVSFLLKKSHLADQDFAINMLNHGSTECSKITAWIEESPNAGPEEDITSMLKASGITSRACTECDSFMTMMDNLKHRSDSNYVSVPIKKATLRTIAMDPTKVSDSLESINIKWDTVWSQRLKEEIKDTQLLIQALRADSKKRLVGGSKAIHSITVEPVEQGWCSYLIGSTPKTTTTHNGVYGTDFSHQAAKSAGKSYNDSRVDAFLPDRKGRSQIEELEGILLLYVETLQDLDKNKVLSRLTIKNIEILNKNRFSGLIELKLSELK